MHIQFIKNRFFWKNKDKGKFSPPRRYLTNFQLGNVIGNEMNAHRLVPCQSYTVSAEKRKKNNEENIISLICRVFTIILAQTQGPAI